MRPELLAFTGRKVQQQK
jgi:hypothetical protein